MQTDSELKRAVRISEGEGGRQAGGCSDCAHVQSCLSRSLAGTNLMPIFESAIDADHIIDAGEPLVRAGDNFDALYVIKSGSFKAIVGENPANILGFYFATHLVGLESISKRKHSSGLVALERSLVCELNYQKLLDLFRRFPTVKVHFIEAMSGQLNESLTLFSVIRAGTVLQRVATFVLYLAAQHDRRKLASVDIVLPMGRTDISNFLGISPESLSRALTSLSKKRLLQVFNRRVTVLNRDALAALAGG